MKLNHLQVVNYNFINQNYYVKTEAHIALNEKKMKSEKPTNNQNILLW